MNKSDLKQYTQNSEESFLSSIQRRVTAVSSV